MSSRRRQSMRLRQKKSTIKLSQTYPKHEQGTPSRVSKSFIAATETAPLGQSRQRPSGGSLSSGAGTLGTPVSLVRPTSILAPKVSTPLLERSDSATSTGSDFRHVAKDLFLIIILFKYSNKE
jgi:hypothetical protein